MSENKFSRVCPFFAFAVGVAAVWLGSAAAALAQAAATSTLGEVMCKAFDNASPFAKVFQYVAYVAGIFGVLRGVYGLKMHADGPAQNKLTTPLMYLAGGTLLMTLPAAFSTIQHSVLKTPSGGGLGACTPGAVATTDELDLMMAGLVANIKSPIIELSSVTAILAGLYMIIHALMKASRYGTDPREHSPHKILTNLGFGALLTAIGDNLNMMLGSLFGTGTTITSPNTLTWSGLEQLTGGATQQFKTAVAAALTFVQLIGVIAFVRGWLMMKKFVEGAGNISFAQALTHILGGCLAINIAAFLKILDTTFGTNLLN